MSFFLRLLPILLFLVLGIIQGDDIHINNAREFIDRTKDAKSGTTVYLDSDITFTDDLSQKFESISNFRGTFDGQGHVISNFKITKTSSEHIWMFKYLFEIIM